MALTPMDPNRYAGADLDRVAYLRRDAAWLAEQLAAEATVVVPVWRTRNLILTAGEPRAGLMPLAAARTLVEAARETVLLGVRGGVAHFAVDLSQHEDPMALCACEAAAEFTELRRFGALMPSEEAGMLAYARGILHWHERHRFCGVCGAPTEPREAGHQRVCTNPDCGATHFPRTDPAVIMLVSRGDCALLGRKAEWPEGMYSTLAGFVEPGESLEEAVAREVSEEVGIAVENVRYQSSQPWPFPASLMLGFTARAASEEIRRNDDELEDARWFTREELAEGAAGLSRRPRSDSIARRLIDGWLAAGRR